MLTFNRSFSSTHRCLLTLSQPWQGTMLLSLSLSLSLYLTWLMQFVTLYPLSACTWHLNVGTCWAWKFRYWPGCYHHNNSRVISAVVVHIHICMWSSHHSLSLKTALPWLFGVIMIKVAVEEGGWSRVRSDVSVNVRRLQVAPHQVKCFMSDWRCLYKTPALSRLPLPLSVSFPVAAG